METQTNKATGESSEKEAKTKELRLFLPEDVHNTILRRQGSLMADTGEKVTIHDICLNLIKQGLGLQ